MALGCFRRISCYCHVGGALHRNCTLGWQGGQCLFQVRLYTWKMRELCPGVLPLPGQYAICRTSLRDNCLWDYMESQAGRQAGRESQHCLCWWVATVTLSGVGESVLAQSYCLGGRRGRSGCYDRVIVQLSCLWYLASIIQKDLVHCAWHCIDCKDKAHVLNKAGTEIFYCHHFAW